MNGADRYRSDAQQVLLGAIEALAAHPIAGLGVDALSRQLGCSRDQAHRAARNLGLAGWAEQPVGRAEWRLTPRATQLSERFRAAIAEICSEHLGGVA